LSPTTTETNARWIEAFKVVCAHFGLGPDDPSSAGEDYAMVLSGEIPIERFVAITSAGSCTYVKPAGGDVDCAKSTAVDYITNDLYAEMPVAVVDLDNGNTYRPEWAGLDWKLAWEQVQVPMRPARDRRKK